jgi:antitoxin component YwqK of YwqJK toxin-antitoxin module
MKKWLVLMLLWSSGSAMAQKIPSDGFDKIRIADGDKVIQADLKAVQSDPDVETNKFYYWASGNSIHATQGGFSGRLLNGKYAEYYPNKNLKQQGLFKKGLKEGIWKLWSDNGQLMEWYTWDSGIKSGKFSLFDDKGNLKQSGRYKNNLLNGNIESFDNGKHTTLKYRNGTVVDRNPSQFWQKVNIFKKLKLHHKQKQPKTIKKG